MILSRWGESGRLHFTNYRLRVEWAEHAPLRLVGWFLFTIRSYQRLHKRYLRIPASCSASIDGCNQGCNEVRWRPGQETGLAPPCSNLRSFESKYTVLQNVHVTLLELFGATRSNSAPPWWFGRRGIVPPLAFRYVPGCNIKGTPGCCHRLATNAAFTTKVASWPLAQVRGWRASLSSRHIPGVQSKYNENEPEPSRNRLIRGFSNWGPRNTGGPWRLPRGPWI